MQDKKSVTVCGARLSRQVTEKAPENGRNADIDKCQKLTRFHELNADHSEDADTDVNGVDKGFWKC